jgi:phage terminase large subunit
MTTESRPLHRYEPFGTAYDVIYSRSRELLVVGPAGTGKSRAILEKIQ